MYGFDKTRYGEGCKHVACSGEEQGEEGDVDAEEAGFVVGSRG